LRALPDGETHLLAPSSGRWRCCPSYLCPPSPGSGAVYSFDPVGSYEREFCRAAGAAQSLVQPFLDNQIYFKNQTYPDPSLAPTPGKLPLSKVLSLVTDTFTSATERHIEVGDGLEIFVVVSGQQGEDELRANVGAELLESLGQVGDCETRSFVLRKELKKD
jgi:20S proteasome subunit beta 6